MSNLRWLRLHHEIIDDPKMRRLTVEERWIWIVCLCLAQRSPVRGSLMLTRTEPLDIGDITAAADLFLDEDISPITLVTDALKHFEALEMVTTENGVVRLTNYAKRQYDKPSNAPEEIRKRVKRHREKQGNAPTETNRNASETPKNALNTETDTETDTTLLAECSSARCKKPQRASPPADDEWLEELKKKPAYEGLDVQREFHKATEWCDVRGLTLSRRRFINWLNRADKPMKGGSNGGKRKSVVDEWAAEHGVSLDGGLREGPQNHRGTLPEPQAVKRPA